MSYCSYILNGKTFDNYTDLFRYIEKEIANGNISLTMSDIVFSKSDKQEVQFEKLKSIKVDGLELGTATTLEGEPFFGSSKMHLLQFLDSDECKIGDRKLIVPFNIDDYRKSYIEDSVKKGATPEQALKEINDQIRQQEQLKEDAKFVHYVANTTNVLEEDSDKYKENVKDKVPDTLTEINVALQQQLRQSYFQAISHFPDNKTIRGINISAKLRNLGKEIFGHIDWLTVGSDGTLHLYLIKCTTQDPSKWLNVKKIKYNYQLSFLKQMLAQNGIDVKNIDLNIIPVQINYNKEGKASKVYVHATKQVSTRNSDSEYAMEKYEKAAKTFIEADPFPEHIDSEVITRANQVCRAIFPTLNLKSEGIGKSAQEWIKYAPSENIGGIEPLVIKKVNELDHVYEVYINGKKVADIKDKSQKTKNKEILDIVTKHLYKLESNMGNSMQRLKEAIEESYSKGFKTFSEKAGIRNNAMQYDEFFGKYLDDYVEDEETGERTYTWEFIPDLVDANILIFRRGKDGPIDIVSLSPFNVNARAELKGNRKNILAAYKMDTEYIDLEAEYGNIELVRAMELLNEILPELGDNVKLGTVSVISTVPGSPSRTKDIGEFNKNYFQKIIETVNKENDGLNIQNNFKNATFSDPVEEIIREFDTIINGKSTVYKREYEQFGFNELKDVNDDITKTHQLESILNRILQQYPSFSNPEILERIMSGNNFKLKNMATLYELVARAYLTLRGEMPSDTHSISKLNTTFFTPATVDSNNIKIVVNNLQITHDTIAEEFLKEYDGGMRKMFDVFYEKCGYSSLQNMSIGNQAAQYSNLFEDNDLMSFKNPYNEYNDLKPHERTLLKQVLFQINRINRNGNSQFTSPEDSRIKAHIERHPEYLWVPLERASSATRRQSAQAVVAGMKNFWRKIVNATESFDEFVNNITEEERELLGHDSDNFYHMSLKNPFSLSIPGNSNVSQVERSRRAMIEKYGKGFFETNVENILIDFLAKHISTTQYNKLLIGTKALLLELHLTGNYNGNKDTVMKEIKYIQDYLKVNVFNTSIMSSTEKKIVGIITPLKRFVTHILIGGNIIGALRDTIEGAQQNFIRSVIKLHTDLDPSDVAKAYAYVWTHSSSNAMAQNLLSKLCLRYRISNTDVGRIAEKAKTGRNGLLNYENWLYSTLRGPDFLNRMTLFVARCIHDGAWEALSLDADGNLKYDWTKDERFKALKYGVKDSVEYKKAKALYFSRIKEYNEDHPDKPIAMTDDLPEPYSMKMINAIKGLGDNIYGAYDKSKKGMNEFASYGVLFGSFSTWMNGIVNNYFMDTQKNGFTGLKMEQQLDENGNKLFFDEYGNQVTEDTGMPVYKNVPLIVQGILPTIRDIVNLVRDDGIQAAKDYIKGNQVAKANVMKLTSDALMWLLLAALFKLLLSPAYKEHKKHAADNPVLVNLISELLYKSSSRSYDQYKGPVNVLQFFGENMNPPFYSTPINLIKQTGQTIFGDKSWKYLVFNNSGLTRSVKDTAFAYIKANEQ